MVNSTYRTVMIIFLVACNMHIYGCSTEKPVLSQVVQVETLTNHVVDIKSYKLPKGYFRGVFWASKSPQFQIWIVYRYKSGVRKELYYDLPAPPEFIDNLTVVTENWVIKESILPENRMTYLVKRKDGSRAFRLYMPLREQSYHFAISENDNGDEIMLFMDLSEYVFDNGIFGYVVIREK